jgi:hypothetical protein
VRKIPGTYPYKIYFADGKSSIFQFDCDVVKITRLVKKKKRKQDRGTRSSIS